jgi:SnoaL-like protein
MTEAIAHHAPTRSITRDEILKVEQECAGVLVRFFHYLDRRAYEKLAALMTKQGIWHRRGTELVGPEAVLTALRERPADFATRHLVCNVVVDWPGGDLATVSYEVSVYAREGEKPPRHMSILTGEDQLERTNGHWLITSKKAESLFRFES